MIRITKLCDICKQVMFWQSELFHCSYCKHKEPFENELMIERVQGNHIDIPNWVDA